MASTIDVEKVLFLYKTEGKNMLILIFVYTTGHILKAIH